MSLFQTEILKSKTPNWRNPYFVVFYVVYAMGAMLAFLPGMLDMEHLLPRYLRFIFFAVYLAGFIYMNILYFSKPMRIGKLMLDSNIITLEISEPQIFKIQDIQKMKFEYLGHAGIHWHKGNRNFLAFSGDGFQEKIEVLLVDRQHKEQLKKTFRKIKAIHPILDLEIKEKSGIHYF